ncbi:MAG: ComF family protein [Candidatus Kapabacteria bacterium]|nr:ComF family protein [Candidatus Kapabacteria bacterium]
MFRALARNIVRAFDIVLFPPHCLLSGMPLHDTATLLPGIDDVAWFNLPPAPSSDALLSMLARHHDRDTLLISDVHALVAIDQEGAALALVHALKYGGRSTLAAACGRVLGEVMSDRGVTCDAVVPVPIHRARYRERGYNQAERIASGVATAMDIPLRDVLRRTRYTGTQTSLNAITRRSNVAGSIVATQRLSGQRILLVDDVLTTGSTLQACAIPLIEAGARHVTVATIAVA